MLKLGCIPFALFFGASAGQGHPTASFGADWASVDSVDIVSRDARAESRAPMGPSYLAATGTHVVMNKFDPEWGALRGDITALNGHPSSDHVSDLRFGITLYAGNRIVGYLYCSNPYNDASTYSQCSDNGNDIEVPVASLKKLFDRATKKI